MKVTYSLRTLSVCVVICAFLSFTLGRAYRQTSTVHAMIKLGADVEYARAGSEKVSVVRRPQGGWDDLSQTFSIVADPKVGSNYGSVIDETLGLDLCRTVEGVRVEWLDLRSLIAHDLRSLGGLKRVQIAFTPLDDRSIAAICGCPTLRQLSLRQDQCLQSNFRPLTAEQVKTICSTSSLRQLNLEGCGINDEVIDCIAGLRGLEELGVGANRVSDDGIAKVVTLQSLRVLDVGRTDITDVGVAELTGLRDLECLDLRMTRVTDRCVDSLKAIRRLKYLDVRGTYVTRAAIDDLERHFGKQCVLLEEQRSLRVEDRASPDDRFDSDYDNRELW